MPVLRSRDALLTELFEFLRIPSISSGDGDPADLRRAAEWVCARVRDAGGEAHIVDDYLNPLDVGTIRCGRPDAPHVLVYGHYDVQTVVPVDVTVVSDGEEEIGGDSVVRWLDDTGARYDAAIVFDGGFVAPGRPALTTGTRGIA